MNSIVFWVDEDERIWAPERSVLRGLGFDVIPIGDATTALDVISAEDPSRIRLMILDIMLSPGSDHRIFSDENTGDGMETGLVLAQRLFAINKELGPRTLFFSRTTSISIIAKAKLLVSQIGGFYLQKITATQGRHFVEWLRANRFVEGG